MANQDFNIIGAVKVRSADENDAAHLHAYCFPERTREQVTEELKTDLEAGNGTDRLVAEASGYPIGQITVKQITSEIAQVSSLAVAGPFRQLGVADHLIDAAEATATANGAKTLEIELAPSETSVIQRYKDWGFAEKPVVVLQKMLDAAEAEAEEEKIEVEVDDTDESTEDEASEADDGQTSLLDT